MKLKDLATQKKIPFVCATRRMDGKLEIVTIVEKVNGKYGFRDDKGFLYRGNIEVVGSVEGGKKKNRLESFYVVEL